LARFIDQRFCLNHVALVLRVPLATVARRGPTSQRGDHPQQADPDRDEHKQHGEF
jgi:hypothetical protein